MADEISLETNEAPDQAAALLEWCYKGNLAGVRTLLDEQPSLAHYAGDPARWEGATPLTLAAYRGHVAVADLLLAQGAGVNRVSKDGSALLMAVYSGQEAMTRLLLDRGADPNVASASGETPLMAAAFRNLLRLAEMLINAGADLNLQTTRGTTDFFTGSPPVCGESALHLAAAYADEAFIRLLLERGADRTLCDHCGQRPVHWAARHRRHELVAMLK